MSTKVLNLAKLHHNVIRLIHDAFAPNNQAHLPL